MEDRRASTDLAAALEEGGVLVQLFEAAPLGWILAEQGRVVYANAGTESIFACARAEIVGRALAEILPERHADVQARRADGAEIVIDVKVRPVRIGELELELAIVRDVTERRRGERRLLALQTSLEQRNRTLETFAFIASHDLQEPLRKIVSFADRLTRFAGSGLDPRAADALARITRASRRMQALLDDLLVLSRVSRRAGAPERIDLDALLASIRADRSAAIDRVRASVAVGALGSIEGEPRQIRQLFEQLLDNALAYRRPGEPAHVTISAAPARTEAGDHAVAIRIADRGIGFDPRHADRIFDVFTRLEPGDEHPGTGIGLAICREICHRHRGSIRATGVPGEGSVFDVVLPVRAA